MPDNVLKHRGERYLLAARGHSDWVKNLRASGEGELRRWGKSERIRVSYVGVDERPELIAAHREKCTDLQRDLEPPADVVVVQPTLQRHMICARQVLGDGTLMVVSTPGHSFGSVSSLIRSAGSPPILLVGDLTYSADHLLDNQLPGLGDKSELLESFASVQAMKANLPDLVVVASHDTTAASKLGAALASPAVT